MTSSRACNIGLYLPSVDKLPVVNTFPDEKRSETETVWFVTEDDLGITSLTSAHIQTTSPQPYALNTQTSNFVTSHMLGQTYATDNSNFGPIYHHHHNTHHHTGLPYSYEKYKMPPSPTANVYQHYQGFYGHQIRQVEYIPR